METHDHENSSTHLPTSAYPLETEVLEGLHELEIEGENDPLVELIGVYLDNAPLLLEAMRAAIASGDTETLRNSAHTLKSSSALFGATGLSTLCAELESMGWSGTIANAWDKFALIEAEYERVKTALELERARISPGATQGGSPIVEFSQATIE